MRPGPARRLPGEEGIWLFVLGDMVVFGLFFATYLYNRGFEPEIFARSQRLLDIDLGVLNTLLLLTSSWFVVLGLDAIRGARQVQAQRLIYAASACGLGFIIVKAFEYHAEFAAGITVITDDFFMYYFMFTGIHLVHVILGIGVLFLLARRAVTAGPGDVRIFENGATFWHMVDLLWIMLFPLIYLVA